MIGLLLNPPACSRIWKLSPSCEYIDQLLRLLNRGERVRTEPAHGGLVGMDGKYILRVRLHDLA